MRTAGPAFLAITLAATVPLTGQERRGRDDGIPAGHLPPPGECRVWYDGRPPGHQPPPTGCREAERIAARDRSARVIYGGNDDRRERNDDWRDRDDDRRDRDRDDDWRDRDDRRDRDADRRDRDDDRDDGDRPRAIPRPDPSRYPDGRRYPGRSPNPSGRSPNGRAGYEFANVAFDNGHKDGYDKGREDARDNDAYDPVRHSRYRSADRGYNNRYGSREQYKDVYREGFRDGYEEGYRDANAYGGNRRSGGIRFPWPF